MSIMDAFTTCMGKYFTFSGRAKRSEFWWFYLSFALLSAGYVIIAHGVFAERMLAALLGDETTLAIIFGMLAYLPFFVFYIPMLTVGSRRLHDIGKSGWWQCISVIPLLGIILLIVWWATNTKQEGDKYGEAMADNHRHRSILVV